jgi:uncharacterized protein (TIGR03118 family)
MTRARCLAILVVGWLAAGGAWAGSFGVVPLVSDGAVSAPVIDPNLMNPWGLTASPKGPWWVSDNGTGVSTLYNGQGQPQPLVVTIPTGNPTGIVFSGSSSFPLTGTTNPARFLFATETGTIAGWNPNANLTNAITKVDNSNGGAGAVYKGLAIGNTGGADFLYATNFRAGTVEQYDTNFSLVRSFQDNNLPAVPAGAVGWGTFGIQQINGQLYVTYAAQLPGTHDDLAGPGNGVVDVFDLNGNFVKRLVTGGPLDSPWGLALAPSSFGSFGGDLLVGNFGDGTINAFDPNSGAFLGKLVDGNGQPLGINGLWGLAFGNGFSSGPSNRLFFTAGINDEADGLFGFFAPVPEPASLTLLGLGGAALAGWRWRRRK